MVGSIGAGEGISKGHKKNMGDDRHVHYLESGVFSHVSKLILLNTLNIWCYWMSVILQ